MNELRLRLESTALILFGNRIIFYAKLGGESIYILQ